jgi:hypothetical protein
LGRGGGAAGLQDLAEANAGGAAEHDQVDEAVGAEPVGAVTETQAPRRPRTGRDERCPVAVLQRDDLAPIIAGDAAHIVVDGRHHRQRLAGEVDAGEDLAGLGDAGKALGQHVAGDVVEVEEDVVLLRPTPRPSRISIAIERRTTSRLARSLRGRGVALHEALAFGLVR